MSKARNVIAVLNVAIWSSITTMTGREAMEPGLSGSWFLFSATLAITVLFIAVSIDKTKDE